ncbi:hypothetical protein ScPMuIL_003858 [Solemya velum]
MVIFLANARIWFMDVMSQLDGISSSTMRAHSRCLRWFGGQRGRTSSSNPRTPRLFRRDLVERAAIYTKGLDCFYVGCLYEQ